ncbi:glucosyltransferase [Madurella fahalii]|uniref:Dol-P-Glc:Glc(2)Man(9)GlcNAc(2)-PP-Dol alpha-1,2-glucosyltransferase n=1 Tax=Madurella fahalii TaxID=1157608 RepID=A0ABQ0GFM4_9PEZI
MSRQFARQGASTHPTYKSPYGPKYFYQSHVAGITTQTAMRTGVKAGLYGGVALFTVIFFGSGIPRLQRDILQKIPFVGNYFVHEIPASDNTALVKIASLIFVALAAGSWHTLVDRCVPEPYLDEVFHIPQAQTYCAGRFGDWDDKITTPPGLYLFSVAIHKYWASKECTPYALRSTNVFATLLIAPLTIQCRQLIETRSAEREGKPLPQSASFYSYHTGLNIVLFPVIFFFSALYYTDVVSTLAVLVTYRNHLVRLGPQRPSFTNDVFTVVMGVLALLVRQTNVFWVVVYMGGLEAVHVLRSVKPAAQDSVSKVHDPPLNNSGPEDWIFCTVTLGITAARNPVRVMKQIWPHITVLGLFAGFVAWNGGVVLGDKTNHIATIHLAQMLYIWPLFAFFSAPLFIPSIISLISLPFRYFRSTTPTVGSPRSSTLINGGYTLLAFLLSLAIIKYNTIIHPFTLADNRHYMFYVFRYTILHSPARRFSLVVAYTLCRWLAWDTLAGGSPTTDSSNTSTAKPDTVHAPKSPPISSSSSNNNNSGTPPSTSTVILLFLATALSLVTAPLVEPRYFILPWVFYRLLVPAWEMPGSFPFASGRHGGGNDNKAPTGWLHKLARKLDLRLVLETIWFIGVNLGTMYMFLWRGYYWRGGDGEVLDGGRVQRFMW